MKDFKIKDLNNMDKTLSFQNLKQEISAEKLNILYIRTIQSPNMRIIILKRHHLENLKLVQNINYFTVNVSLK